MQTNTSNEMFCHLYFGEPVQCYHGVHSVIDYRIDKHLCEHVMPDEPFVTRVSARHDTQSPDTKVVLTKSTLHIYGCML